MASVSAPGPTLPPGPGQLVPRPTRVAEVLRVVLILALVATGAWNTTQPRERSLDDLVTALDAGQVTTLTIQRPHGDAVGAMYAEWTVDGGRLAWTTYQIDTSGPYDEGLEVLAAAERSPRDVDVRRVDALLPPSTPTWRIVLALVEWILLLVLLTGGTYPRLATRWAWFWLISAAWPAAVVFLLLEPTPLIGRGDVVRPRRRLTGGWAFLLATLLGPAVLSAVGT